MSQFSVAWTDLLAWSDQVGRAAVDVTYAHAYAAKHLGVPPLADGMEGFAREYTALVRATRELFLADATGLAREQAALRDAAETYRTVDQAVAARFGDGGPVTPTPRSRYDDVAAAVPLPRPVPAAEPLPPARAGRTAAALAPWLLPGGVASPPGMSFDTAETSRQAQAWDALAQCVRSVEQNLRSGRGRIARSWHGAAARGALDQIDHWIEAVGHQASTTSTVAGHVADVVTEGTALAALAEEVVAAVHGRVTVAMWAVALPGAGPSFAVPVLVDGRALLDQLAGVVAAYQEVLACVTEDLAVARSSFDPARLPSGPDSGDAEAEERAAPAEHPWLPHHRALDLAWAAVESVRRTPLIGPDQQRALLTLSGTGRLGDGPRLLGEQIARGDESWASLIGGTSDRLHLLAEVVEEVGREHDAALRAGLGEGAAGSGP